MELKEVAEKVKLESWPTDDERVRYEIIRKVNEQRTDRVYEAYAREQAEREKRHQRNRDLIIAMLFGILILSALLGVL